jgi:hypothetical protein
MRLKKSIYKQEVGNKLWITKHGFVKLSLNADFGMILLLGYFVTLQTLLNIKFYD